MNNLHKCACGEEIVTSGWNNNINSILRCKACNKRRQALLDQITNATRGKEDTIDTVYVSMNLRDLLETKDFTFDVSYRRQMSQDFQVVCY